MHMKISTDNVYNTTISVNYVTCAWVVLVLCYILR